MAGFLGAMTDANTDLVRLALRLLAGGAGEQSPEYKYFYRKVRAAGIDAEPVPVVPDPCTGCGEICGSQLEYTEDNGGAPWPTCSGCFSECTAEPGDWCLEPDGEGGWLLVVEVDAELTMVYAAHTAACAMEALRRWTEDGDSRGFQCA